MWWWVIHSPQISSISGMHDLNLTVSCPYLLLQQLPIPIWISSSTQSSENVCDCPPSPQEHPESKVLTRRETPHSSTVISASQTGSTSLLASVTAQHHSRIHTVRAPYDEASSRNRENRVFPWKTGGDNHSSNARNSYIIRAYKEIR